MEYDISLGIDNFEKNNNENVHGMEKYHVKFVMAADTT